MFCAERRRNPRLLGRGGCQITPASVHDSQAPDDLLNWGVTRTVYAGKPRDPCADWRKWSRDRTADHPTKSVRPSKIEFGFRYSSMSASSTSKHRFCSRANEYYPCAASLREAAVARITGKQRTHSPKERRILRERLKKLRNQQPNALFLAGNLLHIKMARACRFLRINRTARDTHAGGPFCLFSEARSHKQHRKPL